MTIFQLLMLGASAYFAFKIYEHIQTLEEPKEPKETQKIEDVEAIESKRSLDDLMQEADYAFEKKNYKDALALLHEVKLQDDANTEVLFKIAYILQKSGDTDEAMKHYKKALEFDKDNEFIHNSMASIYRENKDYENAKEHLKISILINSSNELTYYNYGNLLADIGENKEAISMYESALKINSDFIEAKTEIELLRSKL